LKQVQKVYEQKNKTAIGFRKKIDKKQKIKTATGFRRKIVKDNDSGNVKTAPSGVRKKRFSSVKRQRGFD
jgi:hypothetical protein